MGKGKYLKRKRFSKRLRKLFWFILPVLTLCTSLLLSVFGAFIGKGSTKGILIGSQNYFNSNVLATTSNAANAASFQINTSSNSETIQIMNFDPSSGDSNSFDVTYRIYCWLTEAPSAQDLFTYSVSIGNQTYGITATSFATAVVSQNMTLTGQQQQTNSFSVDFNPINPANAGLFPECGICVAAVPFLPDFMSETVLAGAIRKSSREFSVQGSFQETDTIDQMAGFLYEVLSNGTPVEGQTVTLTWDAAKLEANIRSDLILAAASVQAAEHYFPGSNLTLTQGTQTTLDGNLQQWNSITFVPTEDLRYFTLAFYRVTSNGFWSAVSWSDVRSLVRVTLNTPANP